MHGYYTMTTPESLSNTDEVDIPELKPWIVTVFCLSDKSSPPRPSLAEEVFFTPPVPPLREGCVIPNQALALNH